MIRTRTPEEVRRFDIFKLSVVLLLLVLIFFMLLRDTNDSGVATTEDSSASSEVDSLPSSDTTAEEAYPPSSAEAGIEESNTIAEEAYPADGDQAVAKADATPASTALVLLTPAQGAELKAGPNIFSGSGAPNSNVLILANGMELGQTTADANGNWYLEVNVETGDPIIEIQTVDVNGNVTASAPTLSVEVAPPEVAVSKPDLALDETNLYAGSVELNGSGEPGYQVALIVAGDESTSVEVQEDGSWNLPLALEAGTHKVSLQTLDDNGNVVNEAGPFEIAIQQPVPPVVALPEDDVFTGGMALTGTGQPGTTVQLYANEAVIGEAAVDENGAYTIVVNLPVGRYNIDVATLDKSGNAIEIFPALSLPVLALEKPEIKDSANLSSLTMGSPQLDDSGKGEVTGSADPDAIVAVTANGKIVGITTADKSSMWAVNVTLGTGSFEIQAQVLDQDGNIVLSSEKQTVTVTGPAESEEAEHVIDAAAARGEFSVLLDGLEDAGLTDQLSDSGKSFTLFAPTDDAFAALPREVIESWNANPEAYKEILFYLILEGAYTREELVEAQVLTSLAGINVGITTDDGVVLINNVPIGTTIPAGNSIVHAIDQVILPPLGYQAQPPIINISGVSIFTGDYLTVVGTAEPATTILLQVDGENFGALATVNDSGSWQTSGDITSGVHEILAYMLDENGLLVAISQPVSLPVQ